MADNIYDISITAASNGSVAGMNWAEGQAPGTVNNSARQMNALLAQFIADIGGDLEAAGTANALTVTANSGFTTYADGRIIAFKAAADNTGAATLSVNGIGAKSIRYFTADGDTAIPAGTIQEDGLYVALYGTHLNAAAGGWVLVNPTIDLSTFATLTGEETFTNKTLTSPVLTTPQINDTTADHQYVVAVSELAADRTVTLPLLTGNDEFVFKDHTQTLTNKTLTSPTINSPTLTGVDASTTAKGVVELATTGEANIGTDTVRAVVPAALPSAIATHTAAFTAGQVGSYALLRYSGGSTIAQGTSVAGTSLSYTDAGGTSGGGTPAGTWQCMGRADASGDDQRTTLWLRVS